MILSKFQKAIKKRLLYINPPPPHHPPAPGQETTKVDIFVWINLVYREWVKEVVEAPRDDHVVVAADDAGHDSRAEPDSSEARVDRVPDAKRSWFVNFKRY